MNVIKSNLAIEYDIKIQNTEQTQTENYRKRKKRKTQFSKGIGGNCKLILTCIEQSEKYKRKMRKILICSF